MAAWPPVFRGLHPPSERLAHAAFSSYKPDINRHRAGLKVVPNGAIDAALRS